jgi:endonuclease G, mitochondrial
MDKNNNIIEIIEEMLENDQLEQAFGVLLSSDEIPENFQQDIKFLNLRYNQIVKHSDRGLNIRDLNDAVKSKIVTEVHDILSKIEIVINLGNSTSDEDEIDSEVDINLGNSVSDEDEVEEENYDVPEDWELELEDEYLSKREQIKNKSEINNKFEDTLSNEQIKSSIESNIEETDFGIIESQSEIEVSKYEEKGIRFFWHKKEKWYVLDDVIEILTESENPKQYRSQLFRNDKDLKFVAKYFKRRIEGKNISFLCSKTEGILRIIMSIDSPKAEPLKLWLAEQGQKRMEEIENPELGLERIKELYRQKGYSEDWITERLREIEKKVKRNMLSKLIVNFDSNNSIFEGNKTINNWYSKESLEHLYFASLAAFPLHLTVDLLYKLWQNFKNTEGVEIPRIAVSDLLMSGLLHEVSTELFEYPPDLRQSLLQALQQYHGERDILKELGEFMLDYLATHYTEGVAYTEPIREAEEWNALAYFDPAKANSKLAAAMNPSASKNYQTRQLRAVMLTEKLDNQSPLRTLDASERTDFERVLAISKGMKPYIQGDFGKAYEHLRQLPDFKVSDKNIQNTEGVATLELPRAVVPILKQEQEKTEDIKPVPTLYAVFEGEEGVFNMKNDSAAYFSKFLFDNINSPTYNLKVFTKIEAIHPFEFNEDDVVLYYKSNFEGQILIPEKVVNYSKYGIKKPILLIVDGDDIVLNAMGSFDKTGDYKQENTIFIKSIQSTAEKSNKVIVEGKTIGLFTYKLVEVLRNAEKPLPYSELFSRVYTKMTQQTDNQHPSIDKTGEVNLKDFFLEGMLKTQNTEGGVLPKMKVGFSGNVDIEFRKRALKVFQEEGRSLFFDLTESIESLDYTIQFDTEKSEYTLKTALAESLIFPSIKSGNEYELITFFNNIDRVANWQYTLAINGNPAVSFDHSLIDIEFYNLVNNKEIVEPADWRQPITVLVEKEETTYIRLIVKNNSQMPLWVSVVYLSKDFAVSDEFFKTNQILPTQEKGLMYKDETVIPVYIPKNILALGQMTSTEYFKVFISPDYFELNDLNREALGMETTYTRNIGSRSEIQSSRDWDKRNIVVKTVIMTLKLKETTAFSQYSNREGFNELFFDNQNFRISLDNILKNHVDVLVPLKEATNENKHLLHYHNFSVATHKERCMPILVAVNIDLSKEIDINRQSDKWIIDPRIDEDYQLSPKTYSKNNLDLGHMVRRLDPVWGENAVEANQDTFHLTTCVPQNRKLNRIEWFGLEDKIFKNINSKSDKISVLTGPVFSIDDIIIDDILLPLQFWKIIILVNNDELIVKGYLLSQKDLLNNQSKSPNFNDNNFGEYKVYEVPLSKIAELTNLYLEGFYPYDSLHIV